MTKKDLIKELVQKTELNEKNMQAAASAMYAYIQNEMIKNMTVRKTMPFKWVTSKRAEHVMILIGPRQCGKTRYRKMWQKKYKPQEVFIYDIEKMRNKANINLGSVMHEEPFKEFVKSEIKNKMNTVVIIENGTFKNNEEYMQLIKLFDQTVKFEFHFWRDENGQFEKPDPTSMCLVTGYQNITVKEHFNRKAANPNPNRNDDWRRSKNNKYT